MDTKSTYNYSNQRKRSTRSGILNKPYTVPNLSKIKRYYFFNIIIKVHCMFFRSQTNVRSITDMWASLNMSSRLEAAEAGLNKLSSLLQDLIGDSAKIELADKKPSG